MNPLKSLKLPLQAIFPDYSAAAAQTGTHARDAAGFVQAAIKAPDKETRLDNTLRAHNSFDHAITASEKLPLAQILPPVKGYYDGYAAAKGAVTAIIASGAIAGARQRVGKQEMLAARHEFRAGVTTYNAEGKSKYGRYKAADWMNASVEDAGTGLLMLRDNPIGVPLMVGLLDAQKTMQHRKPLNALKVKLVDEMFARATAGFDQTIARLQAAGAAAAPRAATR